MANKADDTFKLHFLQAVGAELRAYREELDWSLDSLAELMYPGAQTRKHDALAKAERGVNGTSLYYYLTWLKLVCSDPAHPGLTLRSELMPPRALAGHLAVESMSSIHQAALSIGLYEYCCAEWLTCSARNGLTEHTSGVKLAMRFMHPRAYPAEAKKAARQ